MEPVGKKLTRSFYLRPTLDVACELLRKTIVYRLKDGLLAADIVEVEAYIGEDDPACHAAVGRTARNQVMYGPGGFSYIYFIYGMYNCFNIVTEKAGTPAAVLIRAVEPIYGVENMAVHSGSKTRRLTNGPGKFCRAFSLTRKQSGIDVTGSEIFVLDSGRRVERIVQTTRIGITRGREYPWRFYDADSEYVSPARQTETKPIQV